MENNQIASCNSTTEQPSQCCVGGVCMSKEQCQGGMFLFGVLIIVGFAVTLIMLGKILTELSKGGKKK